MHIMKRLIDARQILPMRDELVDLQFAVHVVFDQIAHLRATFHAAESAALPYAAGDELESWGKHTRLVRGRWMFG